MLPRSSPSPLAEAAIAVNQAMHYINPSDKVQPVHSSNLTLPITAVGAVNSPILGGIADITRSTSSAVSSGLRRIENLHYRANPRNFDQVVAANGVHQRAETGRGKVLAPQPGRISNFCG